MPEDIQIPDFSGDDFANDRDVQKMRAEEKAHKEMIGRSLSILQQKLSLKESSHRNLKNFLMFKNLEATVIDSYTAATGKPLHVSMVKYYSSVQIGRTTDSSDDNYLFGLFPTGKSYPRTYICKETIGQKIIDLFTKMEVDFDHSKKFSRTFHVLTEDKKRLQDMLLLKDLNPLAAFPEMEVEIQNSACLFRSSRKPISPEEAEEFSELAIALQNIFG